MSRVLLKNFERKLRSTRLRQWSGPQKSLWRMFLLASCMALPLIVYEAQYLQGVALRGTFVERPFSAFSSFVPSLRQQAARKVEAVHEEEEVLGAFEVLNKLESDVVNMPVQTATKPASPPPIQPANKLPNNPAVSSATEEKVKPEAPIKKKALSVADRFAKLVADFQDSKSKTNVFTGKPHEYKGRCAGQHGPIAPKDWNSDAANQFIQHLEQSEPGLSEHLNKFDATIMSPGHRLCPRDPTPFGPKGPNLDDSDRPLVSAFRFTDVCVTFNLDSTKQAQRAVVIFDEENESPQRCVPCPNPLLYYNWSDTPCGIMWFHQLNIRGSFDDYNKCYVENKRRIRDAGQRQSVGETPLKAAIYYPGTTLNLQYVKNNPGHQLWDSLLSISPILMDHDAAGLHTFSKTFTIQTPDCPDNVWFCSLLRELHVFEHNNPKLGQPENTIPVFPGIMSCFESLIVPILGWDHDNGRASKELLKWTHESLAKGVYGFDKLGIPDEVDTGSLDTKKILVYGHNTLGESGFRRTWKNLDSVVQELQKNSEYEVSRITDFAAITPKEQAFEFYKADIVVMPHGGQFGNSIFSRKGVSLIEITCGSYSHVSLGNANYPRLLGFHHILYTPCGCVNRSDRSNFDMTVGEIEKLKDYILTNKVVHRRLHGKRQDWC